MIIELPAALRVDATKDKSTKNLSPLLLIVCLTLAFREAFKILIEANCFSFTPPPEWKKNLQTN